MKNIIKYSIIVILIMGLFVVLIDLLVILTSRNRLKKSFKSSDKYDAILVLGCAAWGDEPSPMLQERLDAALDLYEQGITNKIIVSGDHGRKDYDEVNIMKNYLIEEGVESSDIFMDHAGFSTYESIYRARDIFKSKKIIIVSQKYHLYRSVYIAKSLGLDAYGYDKPMMKHSGQLYRDIREIAARDKDFIKCIFKPKPKYLGEEIPITGDGDVTNDKNRR